MKNKFLGYYRPSKEDFEEIWQDCLIVADANVLLNLYTYSEETWEELIRVLKSYGDRNWLAYQCAKEYHQNRCSNISKEAKRYTEIENDLSKVEKALSERKQHPFINAELNTRFEEIKQEISKALEEGREKHKKLIREDRIRDELTELYKDRVGDELSEKELEDIYQEGKLRYEKKTPPGYKDIVKPDPDCYGDLVLWKEVINEAKKQGKHVVLITDDVKEDWWLIHDKDRLGPRPELLEEFAKESGQRIYIYTSDSFLEYSKDVRGKDISTDVIEEMGAAREEREKQNRNTEAILAELHKHENNLWRDDTLKGVEAITKLTEDRKRLQKTINPTSLDAVKKIREMGERINSPAYEAMERLHEQQESLRSTFSPAVLERIKELDEQLKRLKGPRI